MDASNMRMRRTAHAACVRQCRGVPSSVRLISPLISLLLFSSLFAIAFWAPPGAAAPGGGDGPQLSLEAPPDELTAEDRERYWRDASAVEVLMLTQEDGRDADALSFELDRAAESFLRVAQSPEGDPSAYWRAARTTWLAGEMLPLDEKEQKVDRFRRAEELCDLGLEKNPDCAECMLWKFISMGRLRTTEGMMDAARAVPEMARLLDRALEIGPTHVDNENNSSMGNLQYSSAIFYRILPDWFFIKWMLGVRGDKERALAHSKKALELHPNRLDFRIEVATQLLCIGTAKKDKVRLAEGERLMREAIGNGAQTEDERREIYFARVLLETPKKACGYTGDQIVEIDEDEARGKKKSDKDKK